MTSPGNHEQKRTWKKTLDYLSDNFSNVVDTEKVPIADLDDLTIIILGGNLNSRFCVPNGFLRNKKDMNKLREQANKYQDNKPLLIATHVPRRYTTKNGLDILENGMHVGLFDYIKANRVSGHIHESSGIITPNEEIVK